ncbi:MAG: hypothetical protein KF725_02285 [Cyclobacteriaceae bacterium]|nr:hypothetical protein [Cyclobacteriaceae bacterium]UYN86727.1 MAG: hypothetical protein KIT51_00120 [Cyclobacteriaceae bacterium]
MNSQVRQYLFGLIFIGVGCYQLYINDMLEFSLYACAGSAFIFNALTAEPRLVSYKKPLVIITWVLIMATALLFFYLLRYKFF